MSISQVSGSPASMALGLLHLKSNKSQALAGANLRPNAAASTASGSPATGTGTTTSTSTSSGTSSIDSTFLSLLTDELQNQDPSAPMDSTQMVGQMISLNQLDQLISINSAVGGAATTITGAAKTANAASLAASAVPGSAATVAAKNALLASTLSPSATAASQQFPPNATLSAAALSNAAAVGGAAPLDLSNFNLNRGAK